MPLSSAADFDELGTTATFGTGHDLVTVPVVIHRQWGFEGTHLHHLEV